MIKVTRQRILLQFGFWNKMAPDSYSRGPDVLAQYTGLPAVAGVCLSVA